MADWISHHYPLAWAAHENLRHRQFRLRLTFLSPVVFVPLYGADGQSPILVLLGPIQPIGSPMFGDKPQEWPQKFAFVMVPEFTMMPATAAIEPLRLANRCAEKPLYKWAMHSVDGKPVAASNGILAMVDGDLDQINEHDTVIVCGGLNVQHHVDKRLVNWLRKAARRGMDIGAVCTGAHILAEAHILDGYRCTIHWENLPGFAEAFPEIEATGGLFEIDRDRFTSAGGTSALDMMLAL